MGAEDLGRRARVVLAHLVTALVHHDGLMKIFLIALVIIDCAAWPRAPLGYVADLGAAQAQTNPAPTALRPAGHDIDELVQQALADRFRARDIPDFAMLSDGRRIAVRRELPIAGLTLGPAALPRIDSYEFHLVSAATAQAEADRTKKDVPFIAVDRAAIAGDTATIWIGADFAAPAEPGMVKTCCCQAQAQFERREGRWVFVKWAVTMCA